MQQKFNTNLPTELEPFRERISATQVAYIRMNTNTTSKPDWWQSKIGGYPYLPKHVDYPTNEYGEPLTFLAQINFELAPGLYPFPKKGILQFYIGNDEDYGLDNSVSLRQDNFRILYFPQVMWDVNWLKTSFPYLHHRDYSPLMDISSTLEASLAYEAVSTNDYQFEHLLGANFFQQFGEQKYTLYEEYQDAVSSRGHKMGGYAYFVGRDPRDIDDPMLLLFQIDTDHQAGIAWGDSGVANFFIRERDLLRQDFSKVLYNWDIY